MKALAFTIKCNECENEQVFTNGMFRSTDKIELDVEASHDFVGTTIDHIVIYCENDKCNKWIDIRY